MPALCQESLPLEVCADISGTLIRQFLPVIIFPLSFRGNLSLLYIFVLLNKSEGLVCERTLDLCPFGSFWFLNYIYTSDQKSGSTTDLICLPHSPHCRPQRWWSTQKNCYIMFISYMFVKNIWFCYMEISHNNNNKKSLFKKGSYHAYVGRIVGIEYNVERIVWSWACILIN